MFCVLLHTDGSHTHRSCLKILIYLKFGSASSEKFPLQLLVQLINCTVAFAAVTLASDNDITVGQF